MDAICAVTVVDGMHLSTLTVNSYHTYCLQVWYLLGLLNYLRGSDFKYNARHYLKKGLQV